MSCMKLHSWAFCPDREFAPGQKAQNTKLRIRRTIHLQASHAESAPSAAIVRVQGAARMSLGLGKRSAEIARVEAGVAVAIMRCLLFSSQANLCVCACVWRLSRRLRACFLSHGWRGLDPLPQLRTQQKGAASRAASRTAFIHSIWRNRS